MSTLRWPVIPTALSALVAVALAMGSRAARPLPPAEAAAAPGAAAVALAGTPSCSARACHGGAEPAAGPGVQQNEYSTWLAQDKHALAYEALLGPRAARMAENLAATNPDGKVVPAHQDVRCLACHTNPLAAGVAGRADLRREGVGCESCHGPANGDQPWLGPHTTGWWNNLEGQARLDAYKQYGMTPLGDPAVQAEVCAGCHVGAPAGNGLPARDLNHDLMAAGHPRLLFELAGYRQNLPPHWRTDKYDRTEPGYEARVWAVGRVVSARASLALLQSRVAAKDPDLQPWPEFAEYDCFSCHAGLRRPSWRQESLLRVKKEGDKAKDRRPGSLPPSVWYSSLLPVSSEKAADGPGAVFAELGRTMRQPYPSQAKVHELAGQGIDRLDAWLRDRRNEGYDANRVRALLAELAPPDARVPDMTWDETEQLALAVAALNRAYRTLKGKPLNEQVEGQLRGLFGQLAFPPGFEGPKDFRLKEKPGKPGEFQLNENLDRDLKALLEPLRGGPGKGP
jgi:hypothetical protein